MTRGGCGASAGPKHGALSVLERRRADAPTHRRRREGALPDHKSVVLAFLLGAVLFGCVQVDRVETGLLLWCLLIIGGITASIGLGVLIIAVTWSLGWEF